MRIAVLAALVLAACQPTREDPALAPTAQDSGLDDPDAPTVPPPDPAPVTFEALSKTAEAFTGAISLSVQPRAGPNAQPAMKLEAATGLIYLTELNPGGAEQARVIDWKGIFGADVVAAANPPSGAPSIDLHIVTSETVPPAAPNGGFCGDEKTFAIAMATGLFVGAQQMISLAAFKGDQWPPADETALCGTFNYAPPG